MSELNGYRTHTGDVLRDERTGQLRIVTAIWRGEDIGQFCDGRYYRAHSTGSCALYGMEKLNTRAKRPQRYGED